MWFKSFKVMRFILLSVCVCVCNRWQQIKNSDTLRTCNFHAAWKEKRRHTVWGRKGMCGMKEWGQRRKMGRMPPPPPPGWVGVWRWWVCRRAAKWTVMRENWERKRGRKLVFFHEALPSYAFLRFLEVCLCLQPPDPTSYIFFPSFSIKKKNAVSFIYSHLTCGFWLKATPKTEACLCTLQHLKMLC